VLNILASFAEFEREMIATRIAESRERLKARTCDLPAECRLVRC